MTNVTRLMSQVKPGTTVGMNGRAWYKVNRIDVVAEVEDGYELRLEVTFPDGGHGVREVPDQVVEVIE